MLQTLREGIKSIWAKIILGLIIASFVFAGVGSYLASGGANAVAIVNGEEITKQQYDIRYQQDRNRIGEQFSQIFNTEAMQKQFQGMVLERLIMETLAKQANDELGIFVGRSVIKEQIKNTPQFQLNGKFDADTFRALIGANGWSPSQYEELLRQDMERRQLSAIMDSEFALDSEVTELLMLQGETRSGRYISVDASLLQASISFEGEQGEAQLKQYYQDNLQRFTQPEKISVEYIEISTNDLDVAVTDDEMEKYYNQHLSEYGSEEERRASHILVTVADDADEATVQAAQDKINEIAKRLSQGEDFATIAKQSSDDTVSAEDGGDLGYFGKGIMDPAFEASAFALQAVNDISEVVRSSFGFHIIKLTGIKASQQKPLAEVKDSVTKALEAAKLNERFIEINDVVTEKAFQFSDSLQEVAEDSGLQVKVSDAFPKTGGTGIFANPAVIEAAFSDQVMVDNFNSDVISLGENHAVVLRLKQHHDSRTMSFEEVRVRLEQSLRREQAQLKALEIGKQVLAAINAGKSLSEAQQIIPETLKATWIEFVDVGRNDATMTQQIRTELFKMPHPETGENASGKVNKGFATFSGYTVIQLEKVSIEQAGKATKAQKQQVAQQLAKQWSTAEDKAFQEWLLENADIQRFDVAELTQN